MSSARPNVCRTQVTVTTARRCCGVSVIPAPHIKLQTYLLTYLLATGHHITSCVRLSRS